MDFSFPSKLQELAVILIIPVTLLLKSLVRHDLSEDKKESNYKKFSKYIEIIFFIGLLSLSLFDKFFSVLAMVIFFLYSLDQGLRIFSYGLKNMIKKNTTSNNSKIISIGFLILISSCLLCYISFKNIEKSPNQNQEKIQE